MSPAHGLPRWADLLLLPAVCLAVALAAAGAVVALVGQDPLEVMLVLVSGALGSPRGISYTLYYATTFIFTGLAVSVAFHGGLFNIGGEGQLYLGMIGGAWAGLALGDRLPTFVMIPVVLLPHLDMLGIIKLKGSHSVARIYKMAN